METAMSYGICRCCASEGSFKDLEKSYDWLGTEEVYSDMLKYCFDISLSKQDSHNNGGICEVCITQLRNANNFKKQVQLTEQQFLKKVEEDSGFKTSIIKIEVPRPDDHDIFDDGNLSDGFSSPGDPEYDIPLTKIKIEKMNEAKPKKRTAKASTSKAKKLKKEEGEPSSKRTVWIKSDGEGSKAKIKGEGKTVNSVRKKEKGDYFDGMKELRKHYHNIKVILESSNATPIRSYAGIGYSCCFCNIQATDPADLKRHNLENHDDFVAASFIKKTSLQSFHVKLDITGLQCKQCGKVVDDLEDIVKHLIEVHDKKICTDIPNRIVPFKFDTQELRCYKCLNNFSNFRALVLHMGQHIQNHVCEICNAGFIYPHQLACHSMNHKLGSFQCTECQKVFDTVVKLKSHVKTVHSKVHLNKCGCCGELFKQYNQKMKHMMEVHGYVNTNYKCTACDRAFWNPKALRIHRQRDHLLERRHSCKECDKKFYSSSTLKMHMLTHTGIKEYQCEVCFKCYGTKSTLRQHLRIHANDRKYKCEHCGQSFVQKCSWRGHMRSRHGEDV